MKNFANSSITRKNLNKKVVSERFSHTERAMTVKTALEYIKNGIIVPSKMQRDPSLSPWSNEFISNFLIRNHSEYVAQQKYDIFNSDYCTDIDAITCYIDVDEDGNVKIIIVDGGHRLKLYGDIFNGKSFNTVKNATVFNDMYACKDITTDEAAFKTIRDLYITFKFISKEDAEITMLGMNQNKPMNAEEKGQVHYVETATWSLMSDYVKSQGHEKPNEIMHSTARSCDTYNALWVAGLLLGYSSTNDRKKIVHHMCTDWNTPKKAEIVVGLFKRFQKLYESDAYTHLRHMSSPKERMNIVAIQGTINTLVVKALESASFKRKVNIDYLNWKLNQEHPVDDGFSTFIANHIIVNGDSSFGGNLKARIEIANYVLRYLEKHTSFFEKNNKPKSFTDKDGNKYISSVLGVLFTKAYVSSGVGHSDCDKEYRKKLAEML